VKSNIPMIAGGADSGDQQIGAGNLGLHGGAFQVFGKGQQQRFGDLPSPSSNIPCRIPETCYLNKKP
jgi:hypothetical protein